MNNDLLRVFETETDYDSAKDGFVYPTVSYVRDVDDVRYMSKPLPNYLYIEALADNCEVGWESRSNELLCSTDGNKWSTLSSDTENVVINQGEKLYIKGESELYNETYFGPRIGLFHISQQCNVGGNIMSLLFLDNFENVDLTNVNFGFGWCFSGNSIVNASELILPATTLADSCYSDMFNGCTSLTTAPELPATTLAVGCYSYMFNGCTSLTTPPTLPATTLARGCYGGMFNGCTSLTTAPALPATTLADRCYSSMFHGCTSLTAAPELHATTLAGTCYGYMFQDCTSLTAAPVLPATTLADSCYSDMFNGCTSLTAAPELPATTLASGCYSAMFQKCTSLTTSPELPATTLADNCYKYMFMYCTSLTTSPVLPATTLAYDCYNRMFDGCLNLNYIKMLATDISATTCLGDWVNGVSTNGTFVKNPALSESVIGRGRNGIPDGWTVVDAE